MEQEDQPKKKLSREEKFVQDMLKRASEEAEPTKPNQTDEDPEEINKIIDDLRKKQNKR